MNFNVYQVFLWVFNSYHAMNIFLIVFRSAPDECPAFTVEGSREGRWAASPTGTTITIECAAAHILVGNAILTCTNRYWSSDAPQCDKIGKLFHRLLFP